jgi:hypothetical protein
MAEASNRSELGSGTAENVKSIPFAILVVVPGQPVQLWADTLPVRSAMMKYEPIGRS